jgi:glycine cleavage system T protein (aminomethyltransferase)
MAASPETLRRTPLFDRHKALGAKLVPFAGWEMPVQYTGIREEHQAVRTGVGVFDVSHMGQIETRGRQADALLQRLVSNDVRRMPEGGAQYSVLCRDDGGILDDLFSYRMADEHFLTITNAANHEADFRWFEQHAADFDADALDRASHYAMLAVQGPGAPTLVRSLTDGRLPARFHCCQRTVAGVPMLVASTGYTGEEGVELLVDSDRALQVWDALVAAGATPAGLGARDTLRLEAGLPLHGHELGPGITPLQAGLGWVVSWTKGEFRGRAPLEAEKERGVARKLRGIVADGRRPPRSDQPVVVHGKVAGVVTSGNFSPVLGRGIAMAFLPPDVEDGAPVEIDARGTTIAGRVVPLPFVKKA